MRAHQALEGERSEAEQYDVLCNAAVDRWAKIVVSVCRGDHKATKKCYARIKLAAKHLGK